MVGFAQCAWGISMKNDEKLVRVMVKTRMAKVDEVEGGCWL
jgi:hypothetical protein